MNVSQHLFVGTTVPTQGPQFLPQLQKQCRICLVQQDSQQFLQPCQCSGSLRYVHKKCLIKWIQRSNALLIKKNQQTYNHCCQMCKQIIVFQCSWTYQSCSCDQFKGRIRRRIPVFITLLVLTIVCLGLCITGVVIAFGFQETDTFTFVIILISTIVLGVLLAVLVYVWISDFLMKESKFVSKVHQIKRRIVRKRSQNFFRSPEMAAITNKSKSTGTRMTVFPQTFVQELR